MQREAFLLQQSKCVFVVNIQTIVNIYIQSYFPYEASNFTADIAVNDNYIASCNYAVFKKLFVIVFA
jgi:hypothetical protein